MYIPIRSWNFYVESVWWISFSSHAANVID